MIEITIPKLGLTMESATLARWEFDSGDEVKGGETILVIETDKVSFDVPAPADGIIHPVVAEGDIGKVEEIVGYLTRDRNEYQQILNEHPSSMVLRTEKVETAQTGAGFREDRRSARLPSFSVTTDRIKASPVARSMAATHNLDLTAIAGSGPGGRIIRADILRALEDKEKRIEKVYDEAPMGLCEKEALESYPIQGIRRVIFDNMVQSLTQSAQLTLHTEACGESLIALRELLNRDEQKISYNAILVKISALALRLHPKINASVDGDTVHVWRQIHIGLAMEANEVLIVPVIRRPDLKTIGEINHEITVLIQKTRENKVSLDDLANGTFSISNLGFADIDYFTPIIRPPESAVLGVGRIIRKPCIRDDRVVPEARIGLSLTFDHRIIDGAPGARFLKTIKEMIEDPLLMIS